MSEVYLDHQLIHNSSLACFLLTHFIGEYQEAGLGQNPGSTEADVGAAAGVESALTRRVEQAHQPIHPGCSAQGDPGVEN